MTKDFQAAEQQARTPRAAILAPFVGYGIFLCAFVSARPSLIWASLLLVWTILSAILIAWLTRSGVSRILDTLDRHASGIACGMIGGAAVVFVAVSVLQATHFAVGRQAEDTAYYSQILWNTLHGHFLSGNILQERLYNPPVSTDLGLHVSPIVILALLPAYALVPNFLTLLVIRDVALAAAAWPLFLLARERMGGTAGVAAVILYLANPAVIAQGAEAFYPLHLAPLPFFYALRAFDRREYRRFFWWMIVTISVREDVAIIMTGFGLWALVRHQGLRWVTVGLGVPTVWFAVATLVVQPAFGRWGNGVMEISLAKGSQAHLGIFQLVWGNPFWIVDVLRDGGLNYLYRVLRSVGFVGALGWEGLLAVPSLAANLALARGFYSGSDPTSRFALLSSSALIGASVLIVNRIGCRHRCDLRALAIVALVLVPSTSLVDGVKDAIRERLALYTVENDAPSLWDAVALIPSDASIAAPNYVLPAIAHRRKLYYLPYLHMYAHPEVDYMLIDRDIDRVTRNAEVRKRYVALLDGLTSSSDYETIWQRGKYSLLHRRPSYGT